MEMCRFWCDRMDFGRKLPRRSFMPVRTEVQLTCMGGRQQICFQLLPRPTYDTCSFPKLDLHPAAKTLR